MPRPTYKNEAEWKKKVYEELQKLNPGCGSEFATAIGERVGIRDPRTAAKYVFLVAQRFSDVTVIKPRDRRGREYVGVHKNDPNIEVDANCMEECIQPAIWEIEEKFSDIEKIDEDLYMALVAEYANVHATLNCKCRCIDRKSSEAVLIK